MRWIAGQAQNYSLDQALENLKSVEPDDTVLYRYIFAFSYNKLSADAKDLLYMICIFQAPVDEAQLKDMGNLTEQAFRPAIKQLTSSLLVDDVGDLQHRVYSVHLLVRYFVDHEVKPRLRKDPQ